MSDAKRILEQGYANLARLEGIESVFEADNALRDMRFEPLKRESPVRRNHDAEWNAWCRGIVNEVVGELARRASREERHSGRPAQLEEKRCSSMTLSWP
jgi:hypothetical protein